MILIDVKNIALFSGGIARYIRPLLHHWIMNSGSNEFILVGPKGDFIDFSHYKNVRLYKVLWPFYLPRTLRHPFYDCYLFPKAVRDVRPEFIFSPYHDVLIPNSIKAVIMIHDVCIYRHREIYPATLRYYYMIMLRINLRRSHSIFTVSKTSKREIIRVYGVESNNIFVIPNSFENFNSHPKVSIPERCSTNEIRLFYPGGAEFRKNVQRLVRAVNILQRTNFKISLIVTGEFRGPWERELKDFDAEMLDCIQFLGKISYSEVIHEYLKADVVIYPSLCEGFGRVCLEAMALGKKLACSNLDVLREVALDYAVYFDPYDELDISHGILEAFLSMDKEPVLRPEYMMQVVSEKFTNTLKKILD